MGKIPENEAQTTVMEIKSRSSEERRKVRLETPKLVFCALFLDFVGSNTQHVQGVSVGES